MQAQETALGPSPCFRIQEKVGGSQGEGAELGSSVGPGATPALVFGGDYREAITVSRELCTDVSASPSRAGWRGVYSPVDPDPCHLSL